MNSSSPVCRTCLGIISDGKTFYNIDEENGIVKNVRNIRDMLTFCVPEMDIFISVSPSICETCLNVLVSVYNFKIRCLRVENAIRSYIVANNVMEGSCVDLSNVVKLQITEALKQKNWPQDVIREYIWKVDSCLKRSRKNNPVPPGIFNAMSQSFNSPIFGGTVSRNMPPRSTSAASQVPPYVLPASLSPANNLPENNPVLNQLLDTAKDAHQPQSRKYISVSKNLMPPEQQQQQPLFVQQSSEILNPNLNVLHSVGLTPNLSRPEPPSYPVAPTFATIENIQNGFLTAMSSGDREEAVLVTPQSKAPIITSKKGVTKNPLRSARKETQKELCPVTGRITDINCDKRYQTGLRGVRAYSGPKGKRKTPNQLNNEAVDTVIIDDDDDARKKDDDEVLIMNFDDDDNGARDLTLKELLKSSDIPPSPAETTTKPSQSKKMVVKLVPTVKRKLSPEDVIEEIQSKRKRLTVNLNPSLPYLHTNKKLVVKVRKDTFYKCLLCNFATAKRGDVKDHYQRRHRLCKLCDFNCIKKSNLDEHINARHLLDLKNALSLYEEDKTDYHCFLCQFVGLSVFDLRDHRLRVHIKCNESGFYKCPFPSCEAEDAIAYNVLRHTEGKHDSPRRRECPLCNYRGANDQGLKMHVQSHSLVTKVCCPLCASTLKTGFQLQRHMEKKHNVGEQEGYKSGMVYGPTSDSHENLTTDEAGRITLHKPTSTQAPNPPINVDEDASGLSLVSLSEMLCTQILQEIPEQEDDCTIVDDTTNRVSTQASKRRRVILNKHNKKSQKRPNDSEDCVIISEGQQGIMTVDLSDDDNASASKRTKTNADVIEIIDEDPTENVCSNVKDLDTSEARNDNGTESSIDSAKKPEDGGKDDANNSETSSQLLEKLLDEHFSDSSANKVVNSQLNETSSGIIDLSDEEQHTKVQNKPQEEAPDDSKKPKENNDEARSQPSEKTNISDTQDSDENIIVSDSESENSEVIRKRLDVELTGKSPKKFAKYPSDMFQTDSELEVDNNERASSSTSVLNDGDPNARSKEVEDVSKEKGAVDDVPSETSTGLSQQIVDNEDEADKSKLADDDDGENSKKSPTDDKTEDNVTVPNSDTQDEADKSDLADGKISENVVSDDSGGNKKDDQSLENCEKSSADDRSDLVAKDTELSVDAKTPSFTPEASTASESCSNDVVDISETVQELNEEKHSEKDSKTEENSQDAPSNAIGENESVNSRIDTNFVNKEGVTAANPEPIQSENEFVGSVDQTEAAIAPESRSKDGVDTSKSAQELNDQENDSKTGDAQPNTTESESINSETIQNEFVETVDQTEAAIAPERNSENGIDTSKSVQELNEEKQQENDSKTGDAQPNTTESESINSETIQNEFVETVDQTEATIAPKSNSEDGIDTSKSVQELNEEEQQENDSKTDDAQPNTTESESKNGETSQSDFVETIDQTKTATAPDSSLNDEVDISKSVQKEEHPQNESKTDESQPNTIEEDESVDRGGSDTSNDATSKSASAESQSESAETKNQTTDVSIEDATC